MLHSLFYLAVFLYILMQYSIRRKSRYMCPADISVQESIFVTECIVFSYRSGISPGKATPNNNNNTINSGSGGKKRKSIVLQQRSPTPMVPFSLLANVGPPSRSGNKRSLGNDDPDHQQDVEDGNEVPVQPPPPKKLSRAALKEMVTCRECRTPFKLIMQLNQHM